MKNMLINIYNIISNRFYFKILYLFVSISFVSLLSVIPGIKILNKVLILWGAILIICHFIDIYIKRRKLHLFDFAIYFFIVLTLGLTIIKYPTGENYKIWLVNCILLLSVFSIEEYKNKSKLLKEINIISLLFTSFTFITSILSLIIIFIPSLMDKIKSTISSIDFSHYDGFYSNANTLGIIAAISFALTLYLIFSPQNIKYKYILYFNLILQLVTMIISKCRSSLFILLALGFAFIFIKVKNAYVRTGLIALPSAILLFIATNLNLFMHALSGRYDLWYTAVNLLKYWSPAGVGFTNMIPFMQYYQVVIEFGYLPGIELGGIHNIYLQTAVINGIFALIVLLVILILLLAFIINGIDKSKDINKSKYSVIFALLLGLLLINLMESSLIYVVSFISMIFWIYSSYIIAIIQKDKTC